MDRRRASIIAAATVLAVVVVVVSSASGVRIWRDPSSSPVRPSSEPATVATTPDDGFPPPHARSASAGSKAVDTILSILVAVFVALLAAIVVSGGVSAWRSRPRLRWGSVPQPEIGFGVLPDIASTVTDDADAQRSALAEGSPRNGIVACWLRLERAVEQTGLRRDPAHTSAEFTERVLGAYGVERAPLDDLASLYREARFSAHEITEAQRRRALTDLDQLHGALLDARPIPVEPRGGP
jgi:hypothetical protein